MQLIRQYFEKMVSLSVADWAFFSSRLIQQSFAAKQIVLRPGETENYLSFVEKGLLRYFIPKEENDLTFDFAFAHNFSSAYNSFLTQKPCNYCVETLSETLLWSISYQDLQSVYAETAIGNTIGRLASEDLFLEKSEREISLLNDTAEQRYRKLLAQQPHLIQYIPLKYLASYIGITPQALSRIRKRISR